MGVGYTYYRRLKAASQAQDGVAYGRIFAEAEAGARRRSGAVEPGADFDLHFSDGIIHCAPTGRRSTASIGIRYDLASPPFGFSPGHRRRRGKDRPHTSNIRPRPTMLRSGIQSHWYCTGLGWPRKRFLRLDASTRKYRSARS